MKGTKPQLREDRRALSDDLPPPDWLTEDAQEEWRRVVPSLRERKILTDADLGSLESYCVSIGTVRECARLIQRDGLVVSTKTGLRKNPAAAIQSTAITQARQLAAELGLTPTSRSRPSVRDEDDDDLYLPLFNSAAVGGRC